MNPGLVQAICKSIGNDWMANCGGAIHGHADGCSQVLERCVKPLIRLVVRNMIEPLGSGALLTTFNIFVLRTDVLYFTLPFYLT